MQTGMIWNNNDDKKNKTYYLKITKINKNICPLISDK